MTKSIYRSSVVIILLVSISLIANCSTLNPHSQDTRPISHHLLDEVLSQYVNDKGMVNYQGLKNDQTKLDRYLKIIADNAPSDYWSENEKLAYWINAYNAFTLKLIVKHYPVKSIKDIGSLIKLPRVSSAWDINVVNIGGDDLSLNNIEHNIIRKNFEEPRIHFALVCAAMSCPKLRNEAYVATRLDIQLTEQAKDFLSDISKNQITPSKIKISNLFNPLWYGADFTKKMSMVEYLNQYAPVTIENKAKKSYMEYDWSLNQQ